mgnify:CR=1 FL=1
MVSTSDTAKQVQFSGLKQDAAEAAFKARHSFGSSDAFKQIFDGIDKSRKSVAPSNDAVDEPSKSDATPRVYGRNRTHHTKHDGHKDDTCNKPDDDNSTTEKTVKTPDTQTHIKKAKNKSSDCDADDKKCDDKSTQAINELTDTTKTQITVAVKTTDSDADDSTADLIAFAPELADESDANSDEGLEVAVDDTAPDADAGNKPSINTKAADALEPSPLLAANLKPEFNTDTNKAVGTDLKNAAPISGDLQKAIGAHQKIAPEKSMSEKTDTNETATLLNSQDAEDGFSSALKAKTEPSINLQIEMAQEDGKNKHTATKAAIEKHDDHIELLQNKFSAQGTHPAAGDRAISAALTASDSPAPTHNGSAGGGSPIATKVVATATTAPVGLEGLHAIRADQVTFAGVVHNAKEAPVSLMLPNEQVAVQLNRMAKSGLSQYDLQLHPADLGRVDIRLEIAKDGTVQATVTADNQQTFDMLQRDSRSLERALQQAGLQTDSGSLSFNLRGDGQNQAQNQAQQNNGNPLNKWMEKTLPEEVVQSKVLSFDVGTSNGRVDLRV